VLPGIFFVGWDFVSQMSLRRQTRSQWPNLFRVIVGRAKGFGVPFHVGGSETALASRSNGGLQDQLPRPRVYGRDRQCEKRNDADRPVLQLCRSGAGE